MFLSLGANLRPRVLIRYVSFSTVVFILKISESIFIIVLRDTNIFL